MHMALARCQGRDLLTHVLTQVEKVLTRPPELVQEHRSNLVAVRQALRHAQDCGSASGHGGGGWCWVEAAEEFGGTAAADG